MEDEGTAHSAAGKDCGTTVGSDPDCFPRTLHSHSCHVVAGWTGLNWTGLEPGNAFRTNVV